MKFVKIGALALALAGLAPLAARAEAADAVAASEQIQPAYRKVFTSALPGKGQALLLQVDVANLPAGTVLEISVFQNDGKARLVGSVAPFPAGRQTESKYDIGFLNPATDLNLFEKSAYLALAVVDRQGTIVGAGDDTIVKNAVLELVSVSN